MKLFGFGSDRPFVSDRDYQQNRERQAQLIPLLLAQLSDNGITAVRQLRLEFYFYTNKLEKAQLLSDELKTLGYDATANQTGIRKSPYIVTGLTTPVQMDEVSVIQWDRLMCDVGKKHDCEFDGWEVTPDQP